MTGEIAEISQYFLAEVDQLEPLISKYGVFVIMAAIAVEGFGIRVADSSTPRRPIHGTDLARDRRSTSRFRSAGTPS